MSAAPGRSQASSHRSPKGEGILMNASPAGPRVWAVADLCQAVADALDARFNPVSVQGEISGFARAASGHCYFTLKDSSGQIRCAMFKRAASLLDFAVHDGDMVEVRGRLGVYAQRGDLQLIVESMRQAGAGALFEEFLRLKAKLQGEGLFDTGRKRELPLMPRAIGLVTSRGAAALHDVVTALQRRVPHIPVLLAPAPVQGQGAAAQLIQALENLYALVESPDDVAAKRVGTTASTRLAPDTILLVRGGGSIEDLRAFNDEALARVIARSPVPIVCGVGHETDFTIADFVADVRAPTPTAAAELVAAARDVWLGALELIDTRLQESVTDRLDREAQRVDAAAARLGRPSGLATAQRVGLVSVARRQRLATRLLLAGQRQELGQLQMRLQTGRQRGIERLHERLERCRLRLGLLDPALVLQRGYAWITDADGRTITRAEQVGDDQRVRATLAHGAIDLRVEKQS